MFDFKEKPTERKIIIIIDYSTKRKLISNSDDLEIKMNSPIMIVEDDELLKRDNYPFVANLKQGGLIEPGKILVQDYYDEDNYFPATEAKYKTALKKVMLYQTFFFLLGAKTFKYLELAEISDNSETLMEGGIEASGAVVSANVDVKYKTKIDNALRSQLSIESRVREQKCNIDEAKNFMYKKRLNSDLFLENILENFKYGRNLEQTNIKIRLLREFNQIISILARAKLNILFSSFEIGGKLNEEIKSTSDFVANFNVSWV